MALKSPITFGETRVQLRFGLRQLLPLEPSKMQLPFIAREGSPQLAPLGPQIAASGPPCGPRLPGQLTVWCWNRCILRAPVGE